MLVPDSRNEVEHGRGRDREFGRCIPGNRLYCLEVVNERVRAEIDTGDYFNGFRLGLAALKGDGALFCRNFLNSFEVPEKIEVPLASTVFPVGDGM